MTSYDEIYDMVGQMIKYAPIINTCELVIGLVGNIAACIVILYSKSFHTLTGFYLLSLSTSDLLIMITGILYSVYLYQIELVPHNQADYIMEWIFQTAVMVSTLTVTAFTIERYLAICHPFFIQTMPTISRVKKIIFAIWSISAVLALLPVAQIYVRRQIENEYLQKINLHVMQYLTDIWTVLYFFMPMSVITVMYILIWLKLRKRLIKKQISTQIGRADTRTLMMFVVIIAAFILSWGPYYIYKILGVHLVLPKYRIVDEDEVDEDSVEEEFAIFINKMFLLNLFQQVTYPLSSALNPVIYVMMSKKFRETSKELFSRTSRSYVKWSSRLTISKNGSSTVESAS